MKNFDELIDEINTIIDWYRDLPGDYLGINDLMYQRIQLVSLLSYYATELGTARIEWKNSEAQTERIKRENTKKYLDAGFPMSKASELGKFYSIDQYTKEKTLDGLYNSMRFFYDSINSIIDAMNQHISNLKREEEMQKKSGQT